MVKLPDVSVIVIGDDGIIPVTVVPVRNENPPVGALIDNVFLFSIKRCLNCR